MTYICANCKSPDLIFSATVDWNEERHDWNVVRVFTDRASCEKCKDDVPVKKEQ